MNSAESPNENENAEASKRMIDENSKMWHVGVSVSMLSLKSKTHLQTKKVLFNADTRHHPYP